MIHTEPPPSYPGPEDYSAEPLATQEDHSNKQQYGFHFSEESIRKAFVRKVYSILVCQLSVTVLFIALFLFVEPLHMFSLRNPWLWGLCFVMTLICLILLACWSDIRRQWPVNFIVLAIFTLCESFLLGTVSSCYEKSEVLIAVGITMVAVLALTMFAMQTKYDFTMCSGALLVCLVVLVCFGFLCIFIRNYYVQMVYASLGALVFSMYLVFDTQLMLGGKHKYSLSPEEYIFAALNLYLDIVNMFVYILSIVGRIRGG